MKNTIDQFLADKHLAIVGVSRERMKWGNMLMRTLSKRGYHIYCINPHADMIEGIRCINSIQQLPTFVNNAIITLSTDTTKELLQTIQQSPLQRIWLPTNGGSTDEVLKALMPTLRAKNIDVVYDVCPMMYFVPAHIHKLHYNIRKWTKKLPKELV